MDFFIIEAGKDSFKLALSIAANEEFDILSVDIKSAFLQGRDLDRNVLVVPPPEANEKGKLWLLKRAAYGLIDGSRLFYMELKDKLEQTQTELRRTQAELRLNQGDYERSHVELEQMQEKVLAFHKFLDKVVGSLQRLRN